MPISYAESAQLMSKRSLIGSKSDKERLAMLERLEKEITEAKAKVFFASLELPE